VIEQRSGGGLSTREVCSKCRITTGSLIGPMAQTGSWIRWAAGRGNMVVVAIKYFPMESVNSINQVDISFDDLEFAINPEPRCPVVLLLDASGSMIGSPIQELNQGLQQFWEEVCSDTLAAKRVEVAVVTFGPVKVVQDFAVLTQSRPPTCSAEGVTPIGEAIVKGCAMLQDRKKLYKQNGISYFRPWMILMTDGSPTDDISDASEAIALGEKDKALAFFAIGISDADMQTLGNLSVREPLRLKGLNFKEFFSWLSASVTSVSQSTPGDIVPLKSPSGWAEV